MNFEPIIQYLQAHCGWANYKVACWEPVSEVTTFAVTNQTGQLTLDKREPRETFENRPVDLTRVALRSFMLRYATNPNNEPLYLCLDYRHPAFAAQEEQFDRLAESIGSIPGCFAMVPPRFNNSPNGGGGVFALRPSDNILFLQPYFVKTLWFINEVNIKNGIVMIPPELCAQANLKQKVSVYTTYHPDGTKTAMNATCYYAVPPDHILAWSLALPAFQRKRHGVYAEEIYIDHKLAYYLIPDWCLHSLYTSFYNNWLNKVDKIPLEDISVDVHTSVEPLKDVFIRFSMSYSCAPDLSIEEINSLAPVMHPDFPMFTQSAAMKQYIYEQQEMANTKTKITE